MYFNVTLRLIFQNWVTFVSSIEVLMIVVLSGRMTVKLFWVIQWDFNGKLGQEF